MFYGSPPDSAEAIARINCPVYGFYGENDARINATIPKTKEMMKAAGKTYEPVIYQGAGHGFMRAGEQSTDESDPNRKARNEGWERWKKILAGLKSELTDATVSRSLYSRRCSHPRAELDAHGDFLRRIVRREIRAADLGVIERTAFHVPRADVEAAEVGVAHVRALDVDLGELRDAAEIDAAQVRVRKIDGFLSFGDVTIEAVEIAHSQRFEGGIVEKSRLRHRNVSFPPCDGRRIRPLSVRPVARAAGHDSPPQTNPLNGKLTQIPSWRNLGRTGCPADENWSKWRFPFEISSAKRGSLMTKLLDVGRSLFLLISLVFLCFSLSSGSDAALRAAEPKSYSSYDDASAAAPREDDARGKNRPDDAARARASEGSSGRHREVSRRLRAQRRRFRSGRRATASKPGPTPTTPVKSTALKTRLGIPILYGIDAVHGHNNVIGAVIFPHHVGLGCTRDPALVEEVGRITAEEIRATGINWTFAPCVTVPRDERWGRTYEGFSEDPDVVAELGEAMVRGLQGERLRDPLSVVACAKHFVGDGGTSAKTGEYQQGTTAFGNEVATASTSR